MPEIFGFLRDWWYARARKTDLKILWPECRAKTKDLADAKRLFGEHAYRDAAWLHLGREHIHKIIDALD